jgi:hypothetical protein
MNDHERVADWDAAYVLGALSPADRALYEAHVADCERCRSAIAEIAPLLGLMSRVEPERARGLIAQTSPGGHEEAPRSGHRDRVVSMGLARDRRRRRSAIVAATAAAAVIVALLAVPAVRETWEGDHRSVVALEPLADLPLTAEVELAEVAWGTRVDMSCRYGRVSGAPADGWAYALVVVSDAGDEQVLSTWRARPGTSAQLSAGTSLVRSDIAAVEIRAVETGQVLMRADADVPRA